MNIRRWHILTSLTTLGLVSLLATPFETILPIAAPPLAVRLLAIIQPAILTVCALVLGNFLAPKVGLGTPLIDAWIAGLPRGHIWQRQWQAALPVAIISAGILVIYSLYFSPEVSATSESIAKIAAFKPSLLTRLLYGGIAEEILLRWGLISFLVWMIWTLRKRPGAISAFTYIIAISISAGLFAIGHFPILFVILPAPSVLLLVAVFVGNFLPGLMFGWLFWRRGLEAAMMAHALTHLFAALALAA